MSWIIIVFTVWFFMTSGIIFIRLLHIIYYIININNDNDTSVDSSYVGLLTNIA